MCRDPCMLMLMGVAASLPVQQNLGWGRSTRRVERARDRRPSRLWRSSTAWTDTDGRPALCPLVVRSKMCEWKGVGSGGQGEVEGSRQFMTARVRFCQGPGRRPNSGGRPLRCGGASGVQTPHHTDYRRSRARPRQAFGLPPAALAIEQ